MKETSLVIADIHGSFRERLPFRRNSFDFFSPSFTSKGWGRFLGDRRTPLDPPLARGEKRPGTLREPARHGRGAIRRQWTAAVLTVLASATHVGARAESANSSPKPTGAAIGHARPKPIPPGATTSDWPWFGGPTHDFHSLETDLLKTFPPGGTARASWRLPMPPTDSRVTID